MPSLFLKLTKLTYRRFLILWFILHLSNQSPIVLVVLGNLLRRNNGLRITTRLLRSRKRLLVTNSKLFCWLLDLWPKIKATAIFRLFCEGWLKIHMFWLQKLKKILLLAVKVLKVHTSHSTAKLSLFTWRQNQFSDSILTRSKAFTLQVQYNELSKS